MNFFHLGLFLNFSLMASLFITFAFMTTNVRIILYNSKFFPIFAEKSVNDGETI